MMRFVAVAVLAAAATPAPAAAFDLTSDDFAAGETIPLVHSFDGFGCVGENVSPALAWTGAPEGAQSFALMVHDPDAPTGGAGFWHWIVLDIPADADGLDRGAGAAGGAALPEGARHGLNDYGVEAWGGPCPPEGDGPHRYDFTLYALPTASLEAPEGATTSLIGFLVNANAIARATLQGVFER